MFVPSSFLRIFTASGLINVVLLFPIVRLILNARDCSPTVIGTNWHRYKVGLVVPLLGLKVLT